MSKKTSPIKTFEDMEPIVNNLLEKRRSSWRLEAVRHTDFDDIKQEIKIHVWKKFDQWKQELPFENWLNSIIHNQIFNKKRNLWGNTSKPCSNCYFNKGFGACAYTSSGIQNSECPEFKKWEKKKEGAYNIKTAAPLENDEGEPVHADHQPEVDYNRFIETLDVYISQKVKKGETPLIIHKVFKYLYIEGLSDEQVAKKLNYKSSEAHRSPGYKQISNHRRQIKNLAKEILEYEDYQYIND